MLRCVRQFIMIPGNNPMSVSDRQDRRELVTPPAPESLRNRMVDAPDGAVSSLTCCNPSVMHRYRYLSLCPSPFRIVVAVGTTIADRPPHRSVRALLRIRLPPRMTGEEAFSRVRMQNTGFWNGSFEDRFYPIKRDVASLTATAQSPPPQSLQTSPEDMQPVEVAGTAWYW